MHGTEPSSPIHPWVNHDLGCKHGFCWTDSLSDASDLPISTRPAHSFTVTHLSLPQLPSLTSCLLLRLQMPPGSSEGPIPSGTVRQDASLRRTCLMVLLSCRKRGHKDKQNGSVDAFRKGHAKKFSYVDEMLQCTLLKTMRALLWCFFKGVWVNFQLASPTGITRDWGNLQPMHLSELPKCTETLIQPW